MKAAELRIGNLFDYEGQTVYLLNILSNDKSDFGYFKDSVGFLRNYKDEDCPKPIPLTEEWLLKFGFEYKLFTVPDGDGVYRKKQAPNKEYFTHPQLNKDWTFYLPYRIMQFSNGSSYTEHVHQLQNLFYWLTGKELELK